MLALLAQAAVICGTSWLLWKFVRQYVVKSDFDNLPGPPSPSFLYGNLKQIYDKNGWAFHRELGEKYGPAVLLHGKFGRKLLYVFDPKAMHTIAVKEQYIYDEAKWWLRMNHATLGPGLLATTGDEHRRQRKLLNPAFNINHMREMIPIFYEVTHKLRQAMENSVKSGAAEINMVNWMGRTALELMGQAGLGYSFDPLVEDSTDTYGTALKMFIPGLYTLSGYMQFYNYLEAMVPTSLRRKVAEWLPHENFQKFRKVVDIMHDRSMHIFHEKRAALERGDEGLKEQLGEGKDLMSVLLRANMAADAEDRLPDDQLVGQMSTLTIAAMDTTSNALSITLYLLAKHPEAQAKLRQEILDAQAGGKDLGYDDLVSLPYLDAVCRETLRLHAPAPFRFRETREDVVLPLSEPVRGRDGKMINEIPLPKDTTVLVGVTSSNTSKALWGEDAYEWKPERWLSPLPETVAEAKIPGVYSNLMTFWGGGRACIGFKFSQLEMKVVLSVLISTFNFELTETPVHWNLAGVIYPSAGADPKPALPMKVSLVKNC
ncbi:cytochrome P450 [Lentinus tigrinus ALCF2SS1-7]|uniref:Cytochrome P450 n=1 Tax=Lentinus tigrinus ALCF2SS1-6 TaxID=1328759 RepID=A0A5C2RT95_9APHY|nr:cytochrome P450 [Lentinus tigrinus ALCF2SS1-6]RPD74092.1 cytochrome P450 [Lentinus tigrinus ALCF2SS1-7]